MALYNNMIPFFLLTALAGAGYMAFVFARFSHAAVDTPPGTEGVPPDIEIPSEPASRPRIMVGAALGAVVGLIGPLIFMLPLDSCTFEAEREAIDKWFGVALFVLGAFLLLMFVQWLARFFLGGRDVSALVEGQSTMGTFKSNLLTPALLLLPTLVILTLFLYYPLIDTFRLSSLLVRLGAPRTAPRCVANFTDFFEPSGFDFTALALVIAAVAIVVVYQFARVRERLGYTTIAYSIAALLLVLFFDRTMESGYGQVMFNTFFIATLIVVIGLILGLAIAYLAYQPVKGAVIYRTLLIWPYAISPAIAGIIFFVIFDPVSGILNHVIELLGGQGPEWIKEPWWARATIIVASVWKTLGYNILFYIAGLQTVPPELVEAAAIDGANGWQRFRNVVLPALSPITFFLIVTNLTYAFFNIFGTIDFLTKGGPYGSTSVSIYEIVQLGIRSKDLGRAAAQSLVLFVIVIGVTVFQFRTSGRRVTYGA